MEKNVRCGFVIDEPAVLHQKIVSCFFDQPVPSRVIVSSFYICFLILREKLGYKEEINWEIKYLGRYRFVPAFSCSKFVFFILLFFAVCTIEYHSFACFFRIVL